ncbi:MAG: phytoene/squalene synthase family protein [Gemmatimonadetes bacterium]|nr:phytoene/squalene synthase family protein [Gemmatimonadota bacterium]
MSRDPIVDHCRRVIERGSRSFTRAAALLEPSVRAGAYQLYAWCRYCDDVIDQQTLGHGMGTGPAPDRATQAAALALLRRQTESAIAGTFDGDEPVFRGIARIVATHGIPRHHPFELLDGMAMDVTGRRYRTLEALGEYCYHVAGVVGVMMAHIMGVRDAETLKRAEDLGIAMQLTNIARDVMDDASVGRVYLPLDWLERAGVPPAEIAERRHRPAVAAVVAGLLDAAEERYRRADAGIGHLPFRSAWSIAAARAIYSEIGTVIRRRGAAAWDSRAYVTDGRKYLLVGRALRQTVVGRLATRREALA